MACSTSILIFALGTNELCRYTSKAMSSYLCLCASVYVWVNGIGFEQYQLFSLLLLLLLNVCICSCLLLSNRLWTLSKSSKTYANGNNRFEFGLRVRYHNHHNTRIHTMNAKIGRSTPNFVHSQCNSRCVCVPVSAFVCKWCVLQYIFNIWIKWSVKWIRNNFFLSHPFQCKIITINTIISLIILSACRWSE